jgi:leishmanolysin
MKTPVQYEYYYWSTVLHEVFHIMVFSSDMFATFRTSTNTIYSATKTGVSLLGTTFTVINSPAVLEWARSHFGCTTLEGLPIENQGGPGTAGSHWEKEFMPSEFMSGSVETPDQLAGASFLLLRDSGWYTLTYVPGSFYIPGRSVGCDFFTNTALSTYEGFCSGTEAGTPMSDTTSTNYGSC